MKSSLVVLKGLKLVSFSLFHTSIVLPWPSFVAQLVKNPPAMRDLGSIPGLGRSPREGKGYPLQYSGLENYIGCVVHGVAKSWTRLRDFHFHFTGWS